MSKVSPYAKVADISINDARWTDGFWASRFDVCRLSMIPHMWNILKDDRLSHAYANFKIAAGIEKGEHVGPPFFDGDFYKWLEAVALVYAATKDPALDSLMDEVISVIAKAQNKDGYIHTPVLIAERNRPKCDTSISKQAKDQGQQSHIVQEEARVRDSDNRIDIATQAMTDRLSFEVYNFGHLMTAACRHYEATGKKNLLDVAVRAADYLEKKLSVPDPVVARNNVCPSHYMGLIDLYRTTRATRFRDFAYKLIDSRNLIKDGTDDNQDRVPFRQQKSAVGHAVRANYLYAGVADIYAETGDETLRSTLDAIWENVSNTKTYITGATGALYDGVSPDGGEDHWAVQRVHQAYGREYQLPNTTAYNETCANIGNALWNWRMFKIYGDAKYMDIVETVLYNSMLSGISLDGTKYFYQNTLREEERMPVPLRWPRHRASYLSSFCCPPNVVRTVAGCGAMAYGLDSTGIRVNLYGSNRVSTTLLSGEAIELSQETAYPWKGNVVITVVREPKGTCSISLRIPHWAQGATLEIEHDGVVEHQVCIAGSYASITRIWKAGDRIVLELPLMSRIMLAHPLVEESRNQGAVMRGPIVYCIESNDLPKNVKMSDVLLPSDAQFETIDGEDVLTGTTLLRTSGFKLNRNKTDRLYSEVKPYMLSQLTLTFVPYYAWDNRSQGEMTVWVPLQWR